MTTKAFIIGQPISHSLSPKLHGFWLKQLGIDGSYDAINVPPEYLVKTVRALPSRGFAGGNVTIPHKEKVMLICDELDDIARKVGAVNTLVFKNDKITGSNTDVFGFMENIKSVQAKNALVLGAGGAARGVVVGLKDAGYIVTITNRTAEKARKLAKEFGCEMVEWEQKESAFKNTELLVNTTSIGMKGENNEAINLANLPSSAVVTDIVYNPIKTPLLLAAEEKGCKIIDGLGMLINQAIPGFQMWFGTKPQINNGVREHLISCLR